MKNAEIIMLLDYYYTIYVCTYLPEEGPEF